MARKTSSRMELRRMAEAAESREAGSDEGKSSGAKAKPRARKPAARKTTRRAKEKVIPRRMLMWAVYNGNMKEEARFSYSEKAAAEEKIAQLREKSAKKLYFIQPIKVPLGDAAAPVTLNDEIDTDDEPVVAAKETEAADEEE